jgi:hypothetical protein
MTVRALNFLENWLDDNVSTEPLAADREAAVAAILEQLHAAAKLEGIGVEEFGEEIADLEDFIRGTLEKGAARAKAVKPSRKR